MGHNFWTRSRLVGIFSWRMRPSILMSNVTFLCHMTSKKNHQCQTQGQGQIKVKDQGHMNIFTISYVIVAGTLNIHKMKIGASHAIVLIDLNQIWHRGVSRSPIWLCQVSGKSIKIWSSYLPKYIFPLWEIGKIWNIVNAPTPAEFAE